MEKILFVTHVIPHPSQSGATQRTHHLLVALQKKYDVDLFILKSRISLSDDEYRYLESNYNYELIEDFPERKFSFISRIFLGALNNYRYTKVARAKYLVLQSKKKYDYYFFRYFNSACMVGEYFSRKSIVDVDDVPMELFLQENKYKSIVSILLFFRNYLIIFLVQILVSVAFKKVILTKEADKKYFLAGRLEVVENIPAVYPEDNEVLFPRIKAIGVLSSLFWHPNYEGILYFAKKIWPLIYEKHPDAVFMVFGSRASNNFIEMLSGIRGVIYRGYVESAQSAYAQMQLSVAPFQSGGGSNIKIAESLAFGTPVVSTKHGVRGYEHANGVLVVDDDVSYANTIINLLNNFDYVMSLGQEGRLWVKKERSVERLQTQIASFFD